MTTKTKGEIVAVIGTRPEAIKAAPVVRELRRRCGEKSVRVLSTGRDGDLMLQALSAFELQPDENLGLPRTKQTPRESAADTLRAVGEVLARRKKETAAVLVFGDAGSAFGGALAAFYEGLPVGHVEAGLRTYNFRAPWPEEMHRRLTAPLCRWCFAPTEKARENLRQERIPDDRIRVVGNTGIDALLWMRSRPKTTTAKIPSLSDDDLKNRRLILVTGRQRESFEASLEELCAAIRETVERFNDVLVVWPLPLDPEVNEPIRRMLGDAERVKLLDPLPYPAFVRLMDRSLFIVGDSGGVQEEAPSLGKPLLITRSTTERPETVVAGAARLVGTKRQYVAKAIAELLTDEARRLQMARVRHLFGDGRAAERIAEVMAAHLSTG